MPAVERSISIDVTPERVWEAFVNLGGWLAWNPHMYQVRLLTAAPLAMGSRVRIVLKTRLSSTWEVSEFTPGRSFTWVSNLLGSRITFGHVVEGADGGSRAILRIEASGLTALVAAPILRFFYARNLDHSLQRLKESLEGTPS